MTERQLNYLLLAILCFLFIGTLLIAHVAWGQEKDWQFMGSAYGTASIAGTMGYDDPGIGTQLEASARWKRLELYGTGRIAYQHKQEASSGYTWGYSFQGRGYVWKGLYLLAEWRKAGYRSEFESGTIWQKQGSNYGGGIGYNMGTLDAWLTVCNRETESPNQVWTSALNLRLQLWEWLWGFAQANYSTWDQVYSGVTHRLSGVTGTLGVGVRW